MKKKNAVAAALILLLMTSIIINPKDAMASVTKGLIIFWVSVLPALFPFFFFTKMLTATGFADACGKALGKPVGKIFKTPPISAYIFFMSALCGYPIGAKLISDFYKKNLLSTAECKKILSFCSTSAPIFVIGTVGSYMLNSTQYGVIILVAHYASAIFCGLLFCNVKPLTPSLAQPLTLTDDVDNVLSNSVNSAIIGVLSVGGLIAVFTLIIDIVKKIIPLCPFSIGLIEVTRGALELSSLPIPVPCLLAVITALISFGGLCVAAQSMAYLSSVKIKVSYYLALKTAQAVFGCAVAFLLGLLVI